MFNSSCWPEERHSYGELKHWTVSTSGTPLKSAILAKNWLKWLKMVKNTISWQWHNARRWLTPHSSQSRDIYIEDYKREHAGLQYHLESAILAKNWLKWLKMEENTISRQRNISRSGLIPHSNHSRDSSTENGKKEASRLQNRLKSQPF